MLLFPLAWGVLWAGGQDPATSPEALRVKAELAQLKGHEWAGAYYRGDGLGTNVYLLVAPNSGFAYWWLGCLGTYDQNYGGVQVTGRRLQLQFQRPRPNGDFKGIGPEFIMVRWGGRHYLVPPGEMVKFANEVNSGFEARKQTNGWFLLRRGDEKKAVSGAPDVPEEYRDYLLRTPLTVRISAVGQSRTIKATWCPSGSQRTTPVTLDAGTAKGVKVGMEFHAPVMAFSVEVTKVEDATSQTEVTQCTGDPPPSVDQKLSTRVVR